MKIIKKKTSKWSSNRRQNKCQNNKQRYSPMYDVCRVVCARTRYHKRTPTQRYSSHIHTQTHRHVGIATDTHTPSFASVVVCTAAHSLARSLSPLRTHSLPLYIVRLGILLNSWHFFSLFNRHSSNIASSSGRNIFIIFLCFMLSVWHQNYRKMLISLRVKTLDSQDHEFSVENDVSVNVVHLRLAVETIPIRCSEQNAFMNHWFSDYRTSIQRANQGENRYRSRFAAPHLLRTRYERWASAKQLRYVDLWLLLWILWCARLSLQTHWFFVFLFWLLCRCEWQSSAFGATDTTWIDATLGQRIEHQ